MRALRKTWLGAFLALMLALSAHLGTGGTVPLIYSDDSAENETEETSFDAKDLIKTIEQAIKELLPDGGPRNIVRLRNFKDNQLRIKGDIELNRIHDSTVDPVNLALSLASCTDCQTMTVALQINLYKQGAPIVTPFNLAFAANVECTHCQTFAWAHQYVIPVDDLDDIPEEIEAPIDAIDQELKAIRSDKNIALPEAKARIEAAITQFDQLAQSLMGQQFSASLTDTEAETTDLTIQNEDRDEATEFTSPEAITVQ